MSVYSNTLDSIAVLRGENELHIVVVNYNNLGYTKDVVMDLIANTADFDLTIIDQNSSEAGTKDYLKELDSAWKSERRTLNIVCNNANTPLNWVWNWFAERAVNAKYMCYLNNDIRLPRNFVSDTVEVFHREPNCGIVVHSTNLLTSKVLDELSYMKLKGHHMQGWDFTIHRDIYKPIDRKYELFFGDNWLFSHVYEMGYDVFGCYSSPILHYKSKTVNKKKNVSDIFQKETLIWSRDNNAVIRLGFVLNFSLRDCLDTQRMLRIILNNYKGEHICYKVNFGDYDENTEPYCITDGWRYFLLTDNHNIKANFTTLLFPQKTEDSNVRSQRKYKILPKLVFGSEYDEILYLDSSIEVFGPFDKLIKENNIDADIAIPLHPNRSCLYKEGAVCIERKKDSDDIINQQMQRYRDEGFPEDYGLYETGIIYRRSTPRVQSLMDMWWKELSCGSFRDQLSLTFSMWKLNINVTPLPCKLYSNKRYFSLHMHGQRKNKKTTKENKRTSITQKTKKIKGKIVSNIKYYEY